MTTTPTGNPFVDIKPTQGYQPTAEALLAAESPNPARRGAAIAAERDRLRGIVVALEQENHALRGLVERAQNLRPYVAGAIAWSEWGHDARQVLAPATREDSE